VYDNTKNKSLRDFFRSFPTITFSTPEHGLLNWYPSEYFSQQGDSTNFCISIEIISDKNKIILGAAFLRQNVVVFDPESPSRVGFSRGKCSDDNNRVTTEVVSSDDGYYPVECHS